MATDQNDWIQIQKVFGEALELPKEEVQGFVESACAGNSKVRDEVRELLNAYQGAEEELERPPVHGLALSTDAMDSSHLDGYQLIEEIHRGGQGTVYRAIQESTKREVAIKFMIAGRLANDSTKRRFEREVELVGGLNYPGIVPVFDSGLANEQYFYVMECVDGVHLDQHVREKRLSVPESLALFVEVCEAVNYAQQRGVVHRDLKPSNVLVDRRGKPRILDFGLAKLVADVENHLTVSMTGQVMGTLTYMSPEQAAGNNQEIDTRSDVYSLGVVLFEMLTGELPYALDFSLAENLSAIKNVQPDSQILKRNRIDGEVSTILLKALHKEKDRRYNSAGAMGDDIARYLRGEPIEAKRDSSLYVIRKVLRRNFKTALAGAAFLLLLSISSVVSIGLYVLADRARERADRNARLYETERDELRLLSDQSLAQLYIAEMNLAGQNLGLGGGIGRIKQLTNKWTPNASDRDFRDWEWAYLQSQCDREAMIHQHVDRIWCLRWDPQGKRIAFGGNSGHVAIWTPGKPRDQSHYRVGGIGTQVRGVDWNCEGDRLAACGPNDDVKVWRLDDNKQIAAFPNEDHVLAVAWHPTDKDVLVYADIRGRIQLWNVATQTQLEAWKVGRGVQSIRWSQDATTLTFACHDKTVRVWELAPLREVQVFSEFDRPVFGAEQSEGILAGCDVGGGVTAIEADSKKVLWKLNTGRQNTAVCWNPEGKQFATVGEDRVLRLFEGRSGVEVARFEGHTDSLWALDWSPDGQSIATGGFDGMIRIWKPHSSDINRVRKFEKLRWDQKIFALQWHPKGHKLAAAGQTTETILLDPVTLETEREFKGRAHFGSKLRFDPLGDRVVVVGHDAIATIWEVQSGVIVRQFEGHQKNGNQIESVCWSRDGKRIATGDRQGRVLIWDVATGAIVAEHTEKGFVSCLDWHPNETRLLIGSSYDSVVKSWDFASDEPPHIVTDFDDRLSDIRFSPDDRRYAVSSIDGTVQILNTDDNQLLHTLTEHTGAVESIAWHPSGKRLATGSQDLTVRIWDVERGQQTLSFRAHERPIRAVAWSPDGKRLASGGIDSSIKIWDASKGYERMAASHAPVTLSNRDPD